MQLCDCNRASALEPQLCKHNRLHVQPGSCQGLVQPPRNYSLAGTVGCKCGSNQGSPPHRSSHWLTPAVHAHSAASTAVQLHKRYTTGATGPPRLYEGTTLHGPTVQSDAGSTIAQRCKHIVRRVRPGPAPLGWKCNGATSWQAHQYTHSHASAPQ